MKESLKRGISFGLTSGVITTLGLMVGLHSGTHSRLVVIGGIFTIAIADAFSDALGIHIAEEAENKNTQKEIWVSTVSTFASKFLFALTFLVPVMIFSLPTAIIISILWGLTVLSLLSYHIAASQDAKPWKVIAEHLLIAIAVIAATHVVGHFISRTFQ
jgi:VIT1/CCC1 family predicted Fe2+/Mn2+ transporter